MTDKRVFSQDSKKLVHLMRRKKCQEMSHSTTTRNNFDLEVKQFDLVEYSIDFEFKKEVLKTFTFFIPEVPRPSIKSITFLR